MEKSRIKSYIKETFQKVLNEEAHHVYAKFDNEEERDSAVENIDAKPIDIRGKNIVVYKVGTEKEGSRLKSLITDMGGHAIVGAENTEKYKDIVKQQIADRNKMFAN